MGLGFSSFDSCRPPSPLPSCVQDQALSGDTDVKPSQWGEAQAQELHLREQAAGCEIKQLVQLPPVSPCRVGDVYHQMVADRVQYADVVQQQPYLRQQNLIVQELSKGKKVAGDPELPQQGVRSVNGQENQAHSPASSEEVPSAGAQSPVPALCSSSCSPSLSPSSLGNQTPSEQQELSEGELVLGHGRNDETPVSPDEDYKYHTKTELSQGEASSCHDLSDLSDWEDCFEPELCRPELMNWDSTSEDLNVSPEEDHSKDATSESHISIFSFKPTPMPRKGDDWDKLSILELYEEEGRAESTEAVEADSLKKPVPWEAWAEAPELLHASLPSRHNPVSVAQPGPKAEPAAPSKWRGRLRRARWAQRALQALRGLCCCSCLRPQTQ